MLTAGRQEIRKNTLFPEKRSGKRERFLLPYKIFSMLFFKLKINFPQSRRRLGNDASMQTYRSLAPTALSFYTDTIYLAASVHRDFLFSD